MIRVRFAPSPTGYLHIGGARTALFNWLFANHNKGTFILRIEDTDPKRSKKKYLDGILEDLHWLGIGWDEGPYFQSKRRKIYTRYAEKLVKEKKAHYANRKREAIIFKIPPGKVKVNDLLHGELNFDTSLLGDLVIMKSDGTPTYNFACVVDDAELEITHVIRGDDHISNTPKQLLLYQALGLKTPNFIHIPLILGMNKAPLSKRTGAKPIVYYRKAGFLPQALINYLALLGWSPGANREIVSRDQIIREFRIERVNKTPSIFDLDKLDWMNHQYIKALDPEKLLDLIDPILKIRHEKVWLKAVVKLFQPRMKRISDLENLADFFLRKRIKYDEPSVNKFLKTDSVPEIFSRLKERLKGIESFDPQTVEKACRSLIEELGIPSGDLIHPTRVALTGRSVSPGLFEVISLLGKERTLKRLNRAIEMASSSKK